MRTYAQVKLSIWNDDDFRQLSPAAQHLYFVLLTHPSLSHAGVGDWRPRRLAAYSAGWSAEAVVEAGAELARRLFIVVDEDTEEYLIRSFHRNDDILKVPNYSTGSARAAALIASAGLRKVLVFELRRLRVDRPNLAGWRSAEMDELLGSEAVDPAVFPCWNPGVISADSEASDSAPESASPPGDVAPVSHPQIKGSDNPSTNGSANRSGNRSGNGSGNPSRKGSGNRSGRGSDRGSVAGSGGGSPTPAPSPDTRWEGVTVSGESPAGARASTTPPELFDENDPLDNPAAARCSRHRGVLEPGPCGGCADARKAAERESWRRAESRRAEWLAERRAAIECELCDDAGWIDGVTPAMRCAHDADRNGELVAAVLSEAEERERAEAEERERAVAARAARDQVSGF